MSVKITGDDFNRADVNPIGGNWVTTTSEQDFKLASNAATPVSLITTDTGASYRAIVFPQDQYSQAKLTVTGTTGSESGPGVSVRVSASARTYYRLTADHAASNNVSLAKFVGGAHTLIWSRTQAFTDGDTFKLEVIGTTLRAYYNGTQIGADATDTSVISGYPGICYSTTDTSASIDDWEGGGATQRFNNHGLRPHPFSPGMAR